MNDKRRPWQVLRRETIYDSRWVRLHRDDLLLPDDSLLEGYHVIEIPQPAVFVVPVGDDGRILLTEQYRYINDLVSWEIPGGRVEAGETIEVSGERELREETGYTAERLEYLGLYHPASGRSSHTFHI